MHKHSAGMKILFIMPSLEGGGAEKVLTDIFRHFDFVSYNVTLLLVRRKGIYLDSVPDKVKILSLDSFMTNPPHYIVNRYTIRYWNRYKIRHLLKDQKYDAIVSFMEGSSLMWHQYILDKGKRNISWVHTDLYNFHWSAKFFKSDKDELRAYQKMDEVVMVSQMAETQFKKLFDNQTPKTSVILNLIDRQNIIQKAQELCPDIPAKRRFTIVNVGRLSEQKRQDRLLEAVHILKHDYNIEVDTWILGQGHMLGELKNQAERLNIQKQIHFLGFKSNPYSYIKQADVFVLSSDTEGFSLVVAEALCLGKPIVATKVTGPTEMLSNDYGILTGLDAASIAEAIASLATQPERLEYYAERALLRSEMFAPEKTIKQITELFNTK